ncbi:hypothetical protein XU18_3071 [Perkinsela sp. CCAP 1560/4]|nr:hypothetical protein XU18_3071 [Perkinsela sp. CCAP 1560/4]|eukprot:KNH06014.1 hypothetical protein XU18_3071 [Perkinsela sp. CCAP 1560/4]
MAIRISFFDGFRDQTSQSFKVATHVEEGKEELASELLLMAPFMVLENSAECKHGGGKVSECADVFDCGLLPLKALQ